jgi:methionine-rich copper-binding protein CopC
MGVFMTRNCIGVVLGLVAMVGVSVAAHATLVRSYPSAGETLKTPPKVLQLWFSEMPSAAVSLVTLAGPSGPVKVGKTVVNKDKSISADVPGALVPGAYTLTYRTAADDGHTLRDSLKFSVAAK